MLSGMSGNPRSVAEVVRLQRSGSRVKFLYFWGHQPRRDGMVGPECFSQWWPARFTADGETFPTAEHYMMWRKAVLFDDAESAARILGARHPREAKALGRWSRPARWTPSGGSGWRPTIRTSKTPNAGEG